MSFPGYPYGTVPTTPRFQVAPNANGYVAPVATNPFAALVLASGLRDAFAGASSTAGKTASVVTYDSVYGNGFSKNDLKIDADMIKQLGLPMGLKYEGTDVLIPLPSHTAMKATLDSQLGSILKADMTKEEKATALKMFSKQLAMDFYAGDSCGYKLDTLSNECSGLNGDLVDASSKTVESKMFNTEEETSTTL